MDWINDAGAVRGPRGQIIQTDEILARIAALEAERDEALYDLKRLHRDLDAGPLTGPLALAELRRSNAALRDDLAKVAEALDDIANHRMPPDWVYPEPIDEELAWAQHRARTALAEAEEGK